MFVVVDTENDMVWGPFPTRAEATHWASSRPGTASSWWHVSAVTRLPAIRS
jgi:hypothetical protein